MIQHGSIRGFNLHVAFDQFGNIWNMMKAFVLFMSLWGVKITVWRLCNPKWRRSRHPKSRDNRTQTLQRQDITVIHKTNSCSVFPLSFSQFGCRQPFFFFFLSPKAKSVWFRLGLTAGCSKTPQTVHATSREFTVEFIYWKGKEMLITVSVKNHKINLCQVIII